MAARSSAAIAIAAIVAVSLTACGIRIPADPDGTLDRVSGGTLRVAVSDNPPYTEVHDDGPPTGTDVALAERFAASIDARVEFSTGGEESLVTAMENGEVDLIIGGLTDKSPWFDKVALTGPYDTVKQPDGTESSIVMAAPLGENAFLVALEDFLQHRHARDGSGS